MAEIPRSLALAIETRAAIAADDAVTKVFGWPWHVDAQRMYAACHDAIETVVREFLSRSK